MIRRVLALVAVLALAVTGAAAAAGPRKPKKVKTKGTIYAAILFTDKHKQVHAAGEFNDKVLGRGAIVYETRIVPDTAGDFAVTAKHVTLFTKRGSLSGKAKVTLHQNADGTATLDHGTFHFAHGTAGLKGWSEKGTFTGDLKNQVFKFNVKGTVTKPRK